MSLSFDCPRREREALQEREVKLDPMACQDLRVVQVDQDQMGQRYINTLQTKTICNISTCCMFTISLAVCGTF